MAKDKHKDKDKHDRKRPRPDKVMGVSSTDGHVTARTPEPQAGGHHAAKAHGRATKVDTTLPSTRAELMALHAAARSRRNGAPLDSPAFRAAVMDIERIEIRIAAIDRAADPPLG